MRLFLGFALAFCLFSCGPQVPPAPENMPVFSELPLVPLPVEMTAEAGYLYFGPAVEVAELGADAGAVEYLKSKGLTGLPLTTAIDSALGLPAGGYQLSILPKAISIIAPDAAGIFNGTTTLEQIIAFSPSTEVGHFLPVGTITDRPRYAYRGYMLDVARTFFGVDTVKAVIDRLAPYKINYLHLHLSDDQGWRIEIKSWPALAEIGGRFEVDGTPGGYYTQEQYADIVAYAASRGMTVVPEIDMPGHTNAALSAYAELNLDGRARDPYTGTRVGFSTLDANKEVTYQFVEDVVREISDLTPGPYFHLGGDESSVTPHDDYVKFVREAQQIIINNGKIPVGWDEVALAGLAPGTVVQLWNHAEYAKMARASGNQVLMSPATRTYLDMQYDSTSRIGLHWAAYIEVDSAYNWNPAELTEGITDADILGVEAPLWGETIRSIEDIDYLTFPRLLALAEIGWTAQSQRNYPDFLRRLRAHQSWLKSQGIGTYDTRVLD